MPIPKLAAKFESTLASGISALATTATLSSAVIKDGVELVAGTYGFTIDEGTSDEEYIIADVSSTALTNVIRGLSYQDGATSVVALKKSHRKGAAIKITDHPALLYIVEVIAGRQPFDGVIKNATNRVISDPRHVIDKEYADGLSLAGLASFMVTNGTGLTFNIAPGTYVDGGVIYNYAGASTVALSASSTNYIGITAGNLVVSTVSFGTSVPLATIITSGSAITSKTDNRPFLSYTPGGATTYITPTSGKLVGGNTPSATTVFDALGQGANDGKIKSNIDGVVYDNLSVSLQNLNAEASQIYQGTAAGTFNPTASWSQTFTTVGGFKCTKVRIYFGTTSTGTFAVDLKSGTTVGSGSVLATTGTITAVSETWVDCVFTVPYQLSATTGYYIHFRILGGTITPRYTGSNLYAGGNAYSDGVSQASWDLGFDIQGQTYLAHTTSSIATALQTAIRAATSKTETVAYVTNHYEITSSTTGINSKVLKFMAPSTGTDLSGVGATKYFDCASNASETIGTGGEGKFVKLNSSGLVDSTLLTKSTSLFGNGQDGDVVISSNTSLSRDMYYNNLTINNGFVLNPNGYKVYVKGTFTCVGTGKMSVDGGAGGNGAGGGGQGTAGVIAHNAGTLPAPLVGMIGGLGNGVTTGGAGTAGVTQAKCLNPKNSVAGGAGGNATTGNAYGGGAGGALATQTGTMYTPPTTVDNAFRMSDIQAYGGAVTYFTITPSSGSGGAGGGGGNYGAGGGGSGASGGIIWLAANIILNATITANGGKGGDGGSSAGLSAAGGGGGGGGNGGVIIIMYNTKTNSTVTVNGGARGEAGAAGLSTNPAGNPGNAGNVGVIYEII